MFDIEKFLLDYNIPFWTEGKNCQKGWINITCPFCNDMTNHGGFNITQGFYNCWKCGYHAHSKVLKQFCRVTYRELVEEYATELKIIDPIILKKKPFSFPIGTRKITDRHKKYLINRNFDPEQIEKDWGILGTGSIGEYKFRIVIPIYFNGKIVSFQCRDITDRQVLRYKACEKEKEIIHHKNILYGLDHIQKSCIVVEGITDVWRFGRGAVCTFGTGYTKNQLYLLSNYVEQVFIFFDTEDAAQQHADRLAWELSLLHVKTEIVTVPFIKDPAEMKQKDADYLKGDLLKM